jgi:hypothetical protein
LEYYIKFRVCGINLTMPTCCPHSESIGAKAA